MTETARRQGLGTGNSVSNKKHIRPLTNQSELIISIRYKIILHRILIFTFGQNRLRLTYHLLQVFIVRSSLKLSQALRTSLVSNLQSQTQSPYLFRPGRNLVPRSSLRLRPRDKIHSLIFDPSLPICFKSITCPISPTQPICLHRPILIIIFFSLTLTQKKMYHYVFSACYKLPNYNLLTLLTLYFDKVIGNFKGDWIRADNETNEVKKKSG